MYKLESLDSCLSSFEMLTRKAISLYNSKFREILHDLSPNNMRRHIYKHDSIWLIRYCVWVQVISNDKLKSVKHRVVTNSSKFRASVGFFVTALDDSIIKPAEAVIDDGLKPAIYKPFTAKDFITHYFKSDGDIEATYNHFKA